MKAKLEYIWLDGYQPTQSLRSKTMVRSDFSGKLEDCPMWGLRRKLNRTSRRRQLRLPSQTRCDYT
ncbi:MAG: hypothetical protein ACJ0RQ_06210 [Candidatus Azotimanducaceae bacterium]